MLKKILSSLLLLLFLFCICGCKNEVNSDDKTVDLPKNEEQNSIAFSGVKGLLADNLFKSDDGLFMLSIPDGWFLKATASFRTEFSQNPAMPTVNGLVLVAVPKDELTKPFDDLTWDFFESSLKTLYGQVEKVNFEKTKISSLDATQSIYKVTETIENTEETESFTVYEYTIYSPKTVYTLTYKIYNDEGHFQKIISASIESFQYYGEKVITE